MAHRFFYQYLVGEIPKGLVIDHLCRNLRCVNPDHLDPCLSGENCSRGLINQHIGKTHCIHGHLLDEKNLVQLKNSNERICKICHCERQRKYLKKKLMVIAR